MSTDNTILEIAESYLAKKLTKIELASLEIRLANDSKYAIEFEENIQLLTSLQALGQQKQLTNNLNEIKNIIKKEVPRKISLRKHYIRTAAVAAGVALLASVGTNFWNNNKQESASKYSELKKVRSEIEVIKKSQTKIIQDLDNKANKPPIENKYSGTGFALSNDGYLVTNYHVTKDADSVYIQTRDGNYYKAYTVSYDENADIAILKVENKKFKFSKTSNLPYTFSTAKSGLGERIYTLGYPQDEIVYSEGYISSKNGYRGDSMQYRLELPAEPGQSGAPILDASGAIIGIVTGKESKSQGTTYAVSTKPMLQLLQNIPESSKVILPKSNKLTRLNRSQQIEKIQDFTCVVNVYK